MNTKKAKINDIHSAICRVMEDVGVVTGTGKNAHHKYQYASEHDLLLAVQPSLVRHGISVSKKAIDIISYEKTGRNWHCMVSIHYILTLSAAFASDGAERYLDQICIGCGEDFADKAIAKASTMAYKYLWRQALGIPTGDDPDATKNSRKAPQKKKAPPKKVETWSDAAKEPSQIEIFKSWSDKCYDGFDVMDQFCIEISASKTSPKEWDDDKLASFMSQMDSNNGITARYKDWYKERIEVPF